MNAIQYDMNVHQTLVNEVQRGRVTPRTERWFNREQSVLFKRFRTQFRKLQRVLGDILFINCGCPGRLDAFRLQHHDQYPIQYTSPNAFCQYFYQYICSHLGYAL